MPKDKFCYSLDIEDREFWIHTDSKNWIHFDDVAFRRRSRGEHGRNLEADSLFGGEKERKALQDEIDHFGVSLPIPPDLQSYFDVAFDMFQSDNWTEEHEEQLDGHPIPFFWSEVNPRLKKPIKEV